jgi:hypothetical protein
MQDSGYDAGVVADAGDKDGGGPDGGLDSGVADAGFDAGPGIEIVSFTAEPNPALYGGTSKLTGVFSGGAGSVDNGVGPVTSNVAVDTAAITVETTFKLTVTNSLGDTDSKETTVGVQTVTISDVSPANPNVTINKTKQFSATVTGAADTSVLWFTTAGSIDGNGLFTAPPNPATVTITAKANAKQTVFKQTTVYVVVAPSIISFTANPNPALYGGKSKLTGVFADGTGVVDNGVGGISSGTPIDSPSMTLATTYKLTVTNPAGEYTESSTTVNVQTVTITDVSPANPNVTVGHTKQFSATVTGAADSTVDWTATCGTISSTGLFTAPATPQSCEVTATSHAKPDVSKKTGVTVIAEPHITSFTAAKSPITVGSNTTLTPVFEDGTGSIDQGIGTVTSGAAKTVAPATTTTYTLTVTNVAGDTTTAQVTVTVVPAPSITSFTASPDKVTIGDNQKPDLTAVFASANGETGSVDNGVGAVTSGVAKQAGAVNATTTFTLTVTNLAGDTATRQVTVTAYAPPAIQSFTASPDNPVPYNSTVTFSATFTGGTGSINQGIGGITSGGTAIKPNVIADTTFTLTVTNPASKTATLSITPQVAPGDVTSLAGEGRWESVNLTWTDPASVFLDHIEITWTPGSGSTTVLKGVQSKLITGLVNWTKYTFTVKAVDTRGYKSAGTLKEVRTGTCSGQPDFTLCSIDGAAYKYNICVDQICIMPGCGDATCNQPGPGFALPPDGNPGLSYTRDTTTVPGEPTVTDNITKLEWQGCAAGLSGDVCATGSASTKTWSDALASCNSLNWGGHNDWRLPDRYELQSLVNYNTYNPAIDTTAFPGTPSNWFWTSASYAYNTSNAWYVDFSYGDVNNNSKTNNYYVRCVRGGGGWAYMAYTARFSRTEPVTGSGQYVVLDRTTNLIWQGCPAGFSGADCNTGSTSGYFWVQAQGYCPGLDWGGYSTGWRLPGVKELSSIVDSRKYYPAIDTTAFPGMFISYFWSSAPAANNTSFAWVVNFDNSRVQYGGKVQRFLVGCVRGGP